MTLLLYFMTLYSSLFILFIHVSKFNVHGTLIKLSLKLALVHTLR